MAHPFDGPEFGQFLIGAEHLLGRALDHEHQLSNLVADLEKNDDCADFLAAVRASCVEARAQRLDIETMLGRLVEVRSNGNAASSGRPRILVVDDSHENRELAAAVLEDAGFEVITAADGVEGLIAAHYVQPPVILMDVDMPVLDGFAAARLLKASSATRLLKVIAYTARPAAIDPPLTKFFDDVLAKPASNADIVAFVRRFL